MVRNGRLCDEYVATMKTWKLDGFVYPALQIPTYDETLPGASKAGPYSETGWVNRLGVPAISVPGGFYANGLPFGLEMSGVRWQDGDVLGWATRTSRRRTIGGCRSWWRVRRGDKRQVGLLVLYFCCMLM